MRTIVWVILLGFAGAAAAAIPPLATPRATDLLRAGRMAEQLQRRLELPARHGPGWRPGGGGFGRSARDPERSQRRSGTPAIRIDVHPPAR